MPDNNTSTATVVLNHGEWVTVRPSEDGYLDLVVPVAGGLADGTDAVALHCSPEQAAAIAWGLLRG